MHRALEHTWHRAKKWRTLSAGPVSLVMQFRKRQSLRLPRFSEWNKWRMFSLGPFSLALQYRNGQTVASRAPADLDPPMVVKTRRTVSDLGPVLIVGVGPGLGYALAEKLQSERLPFGVAARDGMRLESFLESLRRPIDAAPFAVDATCEASTQKLFDDFELRFGVPRLVVYAVEYFPPGQALDLTLPAFEQALRTNCVGPFLCAQQAARRMIRAQQAGTIVLIGSTSSVIAREGHLGLSVGRFAQRAIAQVMARELAPLGIHVAHLIIDGDIRETSDTSTIPQSEPEDLAELILQLHRQPRSAWTSEMDCRPWNESFWQHC